MSRTQKNMAFNRRTFMKQSVAAAGTIGGAALLLDACGGSSDKTTSAGPTTVTIMYTAGETPKDLLADFAKKNPDLKVNYLDFDQTRLNATLVAGTPPDFVRTQAPDIVNFAARGMAENLQPYFDKSTVLKQSDFQPINDAYRWDGKAQGKGPLFGMAKDWSQDATIWYNKKLFDQAKIPYPSATVPLTYDELLDLGKRLTVRDGNKIKVYGLDPVWVFSFEYGQILQNMVQQNVSLFNDDLTKADFTTPEARKVMQWYVNWAQARVGPSPLDSGDNPFTIFPVDRLAIVMFGYWYGGVIDTLPAMTDHVGFAPAPQIGSTRVSSCFTATGAWIPAKSKNKDAAWRFMEYFMAGKPAHDRASSGYGLPALKSLLPEIPQKLPYQAEAYQVVQNELQYQKVLEFTPYATQGAMNAAIARYLEPVMLGKATLDQSLKDLTTTVNQLLDQGKQFIG